MTCVRRWIREWSSAPLIWLKKQAVKVEISEERQETDDLKIKERR